MKIIIIKINILQKFVIKILSYSHILLLKYYLIHNFYIFIYFI